MLRVPQGCCPTKEANTDARPKYGSHSHLKMRARQSRSKKDGTGVHSPWQNRLRRLEKPWELSGTGMEKFVNEEHLLRTSTETRRTHANGSASGPRSGVAIRLACAMYDCASNITPWFGDSSTVWPCEKPGGRWQINHGEWMAPQWGKCAMYVHPWWLEPGN